MVKVYHKEKCPICSSKNIDKISELKKYPLTELFSPKDSKKSFPLTEVDQSFLFCSKCQHAFLGTIIDPIYLYDPSNYIFSTKDNFSGHITNFAEFINKRTSNISTCIDIGGNNSILSELVKADNGYILDPNSEISKSKKYKSIQKFYEECDPRVFEESSVTIISSHTLEHIESPHLFFDFISNISNFEEGFLQFPCLEMMNESNRFDLIHNQHIHYFSINSFSILANKYGFYVTDFKYDRDHYGTLQVHLKKGSENNNNNNLNKFNKYETKQMVQSFNSFSKLCVINNDFLDKFNNLYCYGAALMLPITFYHHPSLNYSKGIFDANHKKSKIKYANIDIPIIFDDLEKDISKNEICITATATRLTHRKILSKLTDRNPLYIISPFGSI